MVTSYYALIQPHLLYGLAIRGSTFSCDAQKQLQLLQNNSIKAIVGSRTYHHVSSSYKNLMILKIQDLCKLEIATSMNQHNNSKIPSAFDDQFVKPSNVYLYSTMNNQNQTYYIPKFKLVRLQKSFR